MEIPRFSYHDNPLPFVTQFENIFFRLLNREKLDLDDLGASPMFDTIATYLMAEVPGSFWVWYDGLASLEAHIRKARQVEFVGEIWVGDDHKQLKETLRATVTDKRITKQGIWIVLQIGETEPKEIWQKRLDKLQNRKRARSQKTSRPFPFGKIINSTLRRRR